VVKCKGNFISDGKEMMIVPDRENRKRRKNHSSRCSLEGRSDVSYDKQKLRCCNCDRGKRSQKGHKMVMNEISSKKRSDFITITMFVSGNDFPFFLRQTHYKKIKVIIRTSAETCMHLQRSRSFGKQTGAGLNRYPGNNRTAAGGGPVSFPKNAVPTTKSSSIWENQSVENHC